MERPPLSYVVLLAERGGVQELSYTGARSTRSPLREAWMIIRVEPAVRAPGPQLVRKIRRIGPD